MTSWLTMPILAPMQSWGDTVVSGDDRPTLPFPTRSGLAGMICAALGIDRRDADGLAGVHDHIRFIVAEARPGVRKRDFYTVRNVARASGSGGGSIVGGKFYLSDAAFLAAARLEPGFPFDPGTVAEALLFPAFPLCAGRRAYPLSVPPVHHRDGVPVLPEWNDPFDGLLQLLTSETERNRLFGGRADIGSPDGPVAFYCEKSELEEFGRPVPPMPYRVRDRYHGGYRHWGYRQFDRRDVYCVRIQPEEPHVSVQN